MKEIKAYVAGKKEAEVICPTCGETQNCPLAEAQFHQPWEVECECGNSFRVLFERRNWYRKEVDFDGICFSRRDPAAGIPVRILNLSKTGIRFLKDTGKTLKPNDPVRLRFVLRPRNDLIECDAIVGCVHEGAVGAKFLNLDLHAQKVLGFYLMP